MKPSRHPTTPTSLHPQAPAAAPLTPRAPSSWGTRPDGPRARDQRTARTLPARTSNWRWRAARGLRCRRRSLGAPARPGTPTCWAGGRGHLEGLALAAGEGGRSWVAERPPPPPQQQQLQLQQQRPWTVTATLRLWRKWRPLLPLPLSLPPPLALPPPLPPGTWLSWVNLSPPETSRLPHVTFWRRPPQPPWRLHLLLPLLLPLLHPPPPATPCTGGMGRPPPCCPPQTPPPVASSPRRSCCSWGCQAAASPRWPLRLRRRVRRTHPRAATFA